jgi:hypothetical protein
VREIRFPYQPTVFLSANSRSKSMTVISVIVGSTREGRFSEKPAKWILQQLKKRERVDARLLDLRDFPMPFFDQPATPARRAARLTATRSCRDGPPRSRSPTVSSS